MYWPSDPLARRLAVACFVATVAVIGLIVVLELPQWVWFIASTLAGVGGSLYVGKGGYGGRERDW